MTGTPYAVPAFILIAAALLACATALACRSAKPAGRHSRPARRAHAAKPFADPADTADPDGSRYVEQIKDDRPPPPAALAGPAHRTTIPDLEWWKQLPPPGDPLVEVLTGPATSIRQTSRLTLSVLTRIRDSLAALDTARPAPSHAAGADDIPDVTLTDLSAVATWGKTPAQLTADLAAKYLGMIP